MIKKIAAIFLIAALLGSCASFRPRKIVKWGLLGLGGGMIAGSVLFAEGDYQKIMNNDNSKILATMGGTFIVFGLLAICLDVVLKPKDILGGF